MFCFFVIFGGGEFFRHFFVIFMFREFCSFDIFFMMFFVIFLFFVPFSCFCGVFRDFVFHFFWCVFLVIFVS